MPGVSRLFSSAFYSPCESRGICRLHFNIIAKRLRPIAQMLMQLGRQPAETLETVIAAVIEQREDATAHLTKIFKI